MKKKSKRNYYYVPKEKEFPSFLCIEDRIKLAKKKEKLKQKLIDRRSEMDDGLPE